MNIELWCIGKNSFSFVKSGLDEFTSRIKHYTKFDVVCFDEIKKSKKENPNNIKNREANLILKRLKGNEILVLLDEKGREMNSIKFSNFIENKMIYSSNKVIFLIGGAFGFSEDLYKRANDKISLSKMTFSHQLIRLSFVEQLYRAFTIIKNEKYHNI